MRSSKSNQFVVSVDIGTSKVTTLVGQILDDETLDIIGLGMTPCSGMSKGVIVDIYEVSKALKQSIAEAKMMSGVSITEVISNLTGKSIHGENFKEQMSLKKKKVYPKDLSLLKKKLQWRHLPTERQTFQIEIQQYILDHLNYTKNPMGMSGELLEVCFHLLSSPSSFVQNHQECFRLAHLSVSPFVFNGVASSESVVSKEEKDLGVAICDIGAGTTDVCFYENGRLLHSFVLPIGGDHITNDIALGLRINNELAEKIKVLHGTALLDDVLWDEMIQLPSNHPKQPHEVHRSLLVEIIQPRLEELFRLLMEEIAQLGLERFLSSGMVLTGGTAKLKGICNLAEQVMGMPVRLGVPYGFGGLVDLMTSPAFATSVGMLKWELQQRKNEKNPSAPSLKRYWEQFKKNVKDFF